MAALTQTPQDNPLEFMLDHLQVLCEQYAEACRSGRNDDRAAVFDALQETLWEVDQIASAIPAAPSISSSPGVLAGEVPGIPLR